MVAGRTHIPVWNFEKCISCSICIRACPYWFIGKLDEWQSSLRERVGREVGFPPVGRGDKYFNSPPCVAACPLKQDIAGYIKSIHEGNYSHGLKVILETNPFPSVLGKMCPAPCMDGCIRARFSSPPDIRGLKYFVSIAGRFTERNRGEVFKQQTRRRNKVVAVVGGGIAGLSCAYFISRAGFDVVVFEKERKPGGVVVNLCPEWLVRGEDFERDVSTILEGGVRIECARRVESIAELTGEGYAAIVIATGVWSFSCEGGFKPLRKGVTDLVNFMMGLKQEEAKVMVSHSTVVVIGAGPWANCVAISAVDAGCGSVVLITGLPRPGDGFSRYAQQMGGVVERGVKVRYGCRVTKISKKSSGLVLINGIDGSGEEFYHECDVCIDSRWHAGRGEGGRQGPLKEIMWNRGGWVSVDDSLAIGNHEGVFCCGDVVAGPRSSVAAVASGRQAAERVISYIKGL